MVKILGLQGIESLLQLLNSVTGTQKQLRPICKQMDTAMFQKTLCTRTGGHRLSFAGCSSISVGICCSVIVYETLVQKVEFDWVFPTICFGMCEEANIYYNLVSDNILTVKLSLLFWLSFF